ncbi:hypothetical protein BMG05_18455 [Mycobacterium malmoense]|nr:hypothetical protein BMG05_18455 [Mycobacterium malmoense]
METLRGKIGKVVMTRIERPERGGFDIRIDHADPHATITAELLDQAIFQPNQWLWAEFKQKQICHEDHEHSNLDCYRGITLVHIDGINRNLVYQIISLRTTVNGVPHVYELRWPD